MKEYVCITECYAEDRHRYREGDMRFEENDYSSDTLDTKFELVGVVKAPKKPNEDNLDAGIAAFAKKHNITKAQQTKIFKEAEAVEPHEKLRALAASIAKE